MKPRRAMDIEPGLSDQHIGLEARAVSADHLDVKVWLRLLACSAQVEQAIRTRLRERFGTTLARFDYLAQLERHPDGLRMSALSRYMMVTGGNVTGLTDQLVADGWIVRGADPEDGRACRLRLTPRGRREFGAMAREHEGWLAEMFSGLPLADKQQLYEQLGRLRGQMAARPAPAADVASAAPRALPMCAVKPPKLVPRLVTKPKPKVVPQLVGKAAKQTKPEPVPGPSRARRGLADGT